MNAMKLEQSLNLNFKNLNSAKVSNNNIINKNNIIIEMEKENTSYLIYFYNNKYLINKINNSIVLTNMISNNSQIIKNKENFKLGLIDFLLYNNATLLIPMINKKIFDNNYGITFNNYIPRL
jgi:hypothetical protein